MIKENKKDIIRPPKLAMPKTEAFRRIESQLKKGRKLFNAKFENEDDFKKIDLKVSKWHLFNKELLIRIFDSYEPAEEYEKHISWNHMRSREWAYRHSDIDTHRKFHLLYMQALIVALESFRERIEIIPELENMGETPRKNLVIKVDNKNIFVVHGHDDAAKEAIARYLQKLELNPIILHEQPDKGRTIIEKFEDYSNVIFAIALLTPDDLGKSKDSNEEAKIRARQNVIFELGYFIGKLGRKNVCAIYKEGVELPSDMLGILYIPLDNKGAWKLKIAKEIKHSGIKIDLNRTI